MGPTLDLFHFEIPQLILLDLWFHFDQFLYKLDLERVFSQLTLDVRAHAEDLHLILV